MSKSDLRARLAYHRERGSIGARLAIGGFGITLHSLRRGLVGYAVARWAPGSWIGSLRARLTRQNGVWCAASK